MSSCERPLIVLVETPFESRTGTAEVRAYLFSKYNLALVALASYLRTHTPFDVQILSTVRDPSLKRLLARLQARPPAVVGATMFSYSLAECYEVLTAIKTALPRVHICVGGPHLSIYPRETAALPGIDTVVVGDGERGFLSICRQVVEHGAVDTSSLPPGAYTSAALLDRDPVAHVERELDTLPVPDITLLPGRYREFLSNRRMALLTTSRGCPNRCSYCLSADNVYRAYSPDWVGRALRRYRALGVEHIEFWDETFNASHRRLEALADVLARERLDLTWAIRGAVARPIPDETLLRLRSTGLRLVQFGVETLSPRLLRTLNKRLDPEAAREAFDRCRRLGIRTAANLMVGLPGQSEQEILDDLRQLHRLRPTYLSISIYNWAPGTRLYEDAVREGRFPDDFWRVYARHPVGGAPVTHVDGPLDPAALTRLRDSYVSRFYFDPRYVLRYLRGMKLEELPRAVRIAFLVARARLASTLRAPH